MGGGGGQPPADMSCLGVRRVPSALRKLLSVPSKTPRKGAPVPNDPASARQTLATRSVSASLSQSAAISVPSPRGLLSHSSFTPLSPRDPNQTPPIPPTAPTFTPVRRRPAVPRNDQQGETESTKPASARSGQQTRRQRDTDGCAAETSGGSRLPPPSPYRPLNGCPSNASPQIPVNIIYVPCGASL